MATKTKQTEEQKPAEPKVKTEKIEQLLKCALTQKEIMEQAETMARSQQEYAQAEADRDKFEFRSVKCVRELNFTTGRCTTTRTDTGEVIQERPLNESEQQMELAVAEAAGE